MPCTRLTGDGEKGEKGVWKWGKREIIYLSLNCPHQNDSCNKMDSDEGQFNVSLTVKNKVTRQCPQIGTFFQERRKPKRNRAETLLLTSLTLYRWASPTHISLCTHTQPVIIACIVYSADDS